MCLRPRYITVDNNKTHLYKQDAYRRVISQFASPELAPLIHRDQSSLVRVNCGKCVECLKARQNDLASRVSLYAKECNSMYMMTLTYSEDKIPLSARRVLVDKSTGECFLDGVPINLVRLKRGLEPLFHEAVLDDFRDRLLKMPRTDRARVITVTRDEPCPDGFQVMYHITPSLYRRDVRLWLKRCRVQYEREYGKKMSDFKYVLAGEFGPNTCRPHYHMIFLGATRFEMLYMEMRWKSEFGYTKLKKVAALNGDGSSGYTIAARYVSKYIIKGDQFEADSVVKGYVERPRVCLSRYIGTSLPDELVDYVRCTDLFGRYGLDSLVDDSKGRFEPQLNVDQLRLLYNESRRRMVMRLGVNSILFLPKVIRNKLFSVDESFYSIEKHANISFSRDSIVQLAFNSFVETDLLDNIVSECKKAGVDSDSEISNRLSSYQNSVKNASSLKEASGIKAYKEFYSKSHF